VLECKIIKYIYEA
jgi:hypothetical protein